MDDPLKHIETIARESYGRLLAYLSVSTNRLVEAEDALSEALQSALTKWPGTGLPHNPEAWLLTAARRRLIDRARHNQVRDHAQPTLEVMAELAATEDADAIPDERLKLLFICAHPAIDPMIRTPLMLQSVLGLDASRIASAFLVAPATMSQRLVRAKTKIRAAGIPFREPDPPELPARIDAVLQAIYAAYGTGWDDAFANESSRRGLASEAIWLARVVINLLPNQPEALGLLSLMLHCEARRPARRDDQGNFVPLSKQNPKSWDHAQIDEAEKLLQQAAAFKQPGRFQLETVIQSVHAERRTGQAVNWSAIIGAYDALLLLAPTLGAHLGRIAARAQQTGPSEALSELDGLAVKNIEQHQPYWTLRAHLLSELNQNKEAHQARERAIGLTEDPAVRRFLQKQNQGSSNKT